MNVVQIEMALSINVRSQYHQYIPMEITCLLQFGMEVFVLQKIVPALKIFGLVLTSVLKVESRWQKSTNQNS